METKPPPEYHRLTHSPEETQRLGRELGAQVQAGDLISLRGDLGAGKTTFVQGLAAAMAVEEPVTSPSFTLIHEHPGRVTLYHLDLYRLGPQELSDIGIDDVIGAAAVVAVEWSERLPPSLSGDSLEVTIEFVAGEDDARRITLHARGPRGQRLLAAVREEWDADSGD